MSFSGFSEVREWVLSPAFLAWQLSLCARCGGSSVRPGYGQEACPLGSRRTRTT